MMRLAAVIVYVLIGVAGFVVVLVTRRWPATAAPASTLLEQVLRARAARITVLVFWWWLGWHFFVAGP